MKEKVIMAFIWKFLERFGTQVIQLIIQVILARLLLPNEYGTVAIVSVFVIISSVIIQNGFNTALIQKKEIDDTDLSSVLYFTLILALIIYLILFFIAPLISNLYSTKLTSIIRVLSISLFFGAFNAVYQAIIVRKMQFKKLFFTNLISVLLSGVTGVIMAYSGYGVWSLVFEQLISTIVISIILYFITDFKPRFIFSINRLKILFKFGSKMLISSIIDTIYNNIYDLIIGKKYKSTSLGYYNRGKQFPSIIVQNIDSSISQVMFPVLSKEQDNKLKIKKMMKRTLKTSCYFIFPIIIGLFVCSENIIKVVLTDKWLGCLFYLKAACVVYIFWPFHSTNVQAIISIGRSDIFLKLEVLKKIVGIIVLIITLQYGVKEIIYGQIIVSFICIFINSYPSKKLFKYNTISQFIDVLPSLIISMIMGAIVYLIGRINLSIIPLLCIQVISGIIIYTLLSIIFKSESFSYLKNIVLNYKKNKNYNIFML